MAFDVAQLAFSIDSSDATQATRDLRGLRTEGERAPQWMVNLARQSRNSTGSLNDMSRGANNVSREASTASRELHRIGDSSSSIRQAADEASSFSRIAKGLAGGLAAIGVASFVKETVQLSRAMGNAIGEMRSLGVAESELQTLGEQALEGAGDYGVSATAFVSASYDIQSAISGLEAGQLGVITQSMATLAIGTKSSTETMTSMMGTMYGIFQGAADKMGVGEFSKQVAAMTAKSVQAFKTTGSAMSQRLVLLAQSVRRWARRWKSNSLFSERYKRQCQERKQVQNTKHLWRALSVHKKN